MNRWLYRAAGAAGIASAVLLAAGNAHADQTEQVENLISDVFAPTHGLPGLPATDLESLLGELPLAGAPLDATSLTGALGGEQGGFGPLGGGGGQLDPQVGLGIPLGQLVDIQGQLTKLPFGSVGPLSRQAPLRPMPLRPQPLPSHLTTTPAEPEIVGPLPFLTQPVTSSLLGDLGGVKDLLAVTDLTGQVPVAGPVLDQTTSSLPVVSDVMPKPSHVVPGNQPTSSHPAPSRSAAGPSGAPTAPAGAPTAPAGAPTAPAGAPTAPAGAPVDGAGAPAGGATDAGAPADPAGALGAPVPAGAAPVPPVIADELAAELGADPELFGGAGSAELLAPLMGALDPVNSMFGFGNLPAQLPLVGPLAGPFLGQLPVVEDPAAEIPMERPVAGEDPEYAD